MTREKRFFVLKFLTRFSGPELSAILFFNLVLCGLSANTNITSSNSVENPFSNKPNLNRHLMVVYYGIAMNRYIFNFNIYLSRKFL